MDYLDFMALGDLPLKQKVKDFVSNYEISCFDELDHDGQLELLYTAYQEEKEVDIFEFLECNADRELFQKSFLAVLGGSKNARRTFKSILMKAFKDYYKDFIDELIECAHEQYLTDKKEEARDYYSSHIAYTDAMLQSFHLY